MFYLTKFLFIVGGMGLVLISAIRITLVESLTVHEAILDGYYLFLGIVVGLSQMNIRAITCNFRFLNYHWGKCLFSLFLASMSFGSGSKQEHIQWIHYLVTIYFFMVGILFLLLSIVDSKRDVFQAKLDKIDILQNS